VRYDLTGGPPVNPRRRLPWWLKKPPLWMLIDREIRQDVYLAMDLLAL
jgi:hypothetical protein